jgi:hypothetical protein
MSHLTRTIQKSIFKTTLGPRLDEMSFGTADREHMDTELSVATAMTPMEVGPGLRRLPGSVHFPGHEVKNIQPRRRGHGY